jgi:glycosyltransferase involved in cell wall biosynthesis
MGLPVIATNDGGIPETLVGQKHIIIDKNKNMPTQIANAILKIKNDNAFYFGNKLNQQFTKETYAQSFFNNIEDIS